MPFLAGLPLLGSPKGRNSSRQFVQGSQDPALYPMGRRSPLFFLFAAVVPDDLIFWAESAPNKPGPETAGYPCPARQATAARLTEDTAPQTPDFRKVGS